MANIKDNNTEQTILEAAEQVFLSKGYAASRTTEIARLAGVNHAMLHYYFRSKENLFDRVFDQKLLLLNESLSVVLEKELPFIEKIKMAVETHFDFLLTNPKLPFFVLNEITVSTERREMFKKLLLPKLFKAFNVLGEEIKAEIQKGNISDISPADLILNIGALNAATILAASVLMGGEENEESRKEFLEKRKAQNVEFILKSLRP